MKANREDQQRLMGVTSADLQIRKREDGSESREIEGYAIVFGQDSAQLWDEKGKPVYEVIGRGSITKELLDASDIKMTMYHDMSRLLARSNKGKGTLAYDVDERGVKFVFEAPNTVYGDEALELVRRGIIDGCSFMFATRYGKRDHVSRSESDDRITYTVEKVLGIYDFTLTPDPAYPSTECKARSAAAAEPEQEDTQGWDDSQVKEMRKYSY